MRISNQTLHNNFKNTTAEHTSTSVHAMSDISLEEEDYDNIMSGVEELYSNSDDNSPNNELFVTPTSFTI